MPVFRAFRLFAYLRRHLLAGLTECRYVASVGLNDKGYQASPAPPKWRLLVFYQRLHPELPAPAGISQSAAFDVRAEHLYREQAQQYRSPDPPGHLGHVERDAEILREISRHKRLQGPLCPRLVVDALQMVRYALVDHAHLIGNLFGGISEDYEVHHLPLAFTQYGVRFHSPMLSPKDRIRPIE